MTPSRSGRPRQRVAVVGGGWAGLSAAVRAAGDGHHVTVFEASRHWGGRARSVHTTLPNGEEVALDNGQHILIGAYTDTLRLMRLVGVDTDRSLLRLPLALVYPDGSGLRLPAWGTAKPGATASVWAQLVTRTSHALALPVLAGVSAARGWTWGDKLALLLTATRWQWRGFACDARTTVAELCQGLPRALMDGFIDPLCVSALNTPAHRASGQVFLRVLKDALFGVPGGADLLLPATDLGALFPHAATRWLAAHPRAADLRLGTRVTQVSPNPVPPAHTDGRQASVLPDSNPSPSALSAWGWQVNGEPFDRVVWANQDTKCLSALVSNGFIATQSDPTDCGTQAESIVHWATRSQALGFEAIATVYAWCDGPAQQAHVLPRPMTALHSQETAPAQFVFDRSWLNGPKGLLAFVVSASEADASALTGQVCRQAHTQLGLRVTPIRTIVEKRATFSCTPGLLRPGAVIAPNLVAAGDHIDGPYPATLEGAVRSGWYAGGHPLDEDPVSDGTRPVSR